MPDILLLIFTGMVAFSTVVYAGLTWKLAAETRRMREAQTEPRMSVRAEISERAPAGGLDLVIRNEGQGPAHNIQFEFQGDPTYFDKDRPVDQFPIIKNGLPYLGPNQAFRFLMGYLFGESFQRAAQAPWTFHIRYENQLGKPVNGRYVVDFSQFSHIIIGGQAPLHDIAKHLESLQRDVHHLTTGFNKIRVITQTKEEEKKELEDLVRRRQGSEGNDDEASNL